MPADTTGLQDVDWEPCPLEARPDPQLTQQLRRQIRLVPDYVDYFTACPWLVRQFAYWLATNIPIVALDPSLGEMISLVVAQDNSCRYCYAATRVMLRALGVDDDRIGAIEQDLATGAHDAATRAVLDFARRLSRANPLPGPAAAAPLRAAGLGRDAIREVVYLTGLYVIANRVVTLPAVPVENIERLSGRRSLALLRYVLPRMVHRSRRRFRPAPLPPQMREGPFAYVVRTFDGHPLGPRLWTQIDEAWGSDILPRRTKAVIAAVVARALGCPLLEAEARRLLAAEEAAVDLDTVLLHLASPTLTEAEAAIVPFVRETVHYTPALIQRRGRAVLERVGPAAFLDAIGTAALANALCRMGAVLAERSP